MDTTTQSSTAQSFGNMSSTSATPRLKEYSCKPYESDTDLIKGVKIFCYCVLFLLAVLGNSLLIAIIKKNKRMQTITNYLIINMAVSDILITVLAVPRQITETLLGPRRWLVDGLLGSVLCKSLSFFQDISTAVSIISLVVIAIDRYRAIVFPLRKEVMKPTKVGKIIIPLIWIISMGLHIVYFYIFRTVTYDGKTYCTLRWAPKFDERSSQETYYIIVLVCEVALPACVVTLLYSAIILNLKRNGVARRKGPSSCVTSRRLREDTKVVRIIIAILITFIVCVIPINVFGILFYFVWDWTMPCGIENIVFAAHFILYSNASANPCIYFTLNEKYRRGLMDILKEFHIVRNRSSVTDEGTELVTVKQEAPCI
ncbi:neuropeptide Y receptor type 6-like [Oculina patagonica]